MLKISGFEKDTVIHLHCGTVGSFLQLLYSPLAYCVLGAALPSSHESKLVTGD